MRAWLGLEMSVEPGLWGRIVAGFDRGFSNFANSGLVRMLSKHYATPELDVTLCLERLNRQEPKQLVIGLRWLGSMTTRHTSRAAPRVLELIRHDDASVRQAAESAREALAKRFGAPWI